MEYFAIVLAVAFASSTAATVVETVYYKLSEEEHNSLRKLDNVGKLDSNFALSQHARYCLVEMLEKGLPAINHPCHPSELNEGENIYEIFGSISTNDAFKVAIKNWYNEVKNIPFKKPNWYMILKTNDPSKPVGHFTQMVWKATTKVGCAVGSKGHRQLVICRYSPQGNKFTAISLKNNVFAPVDSNCSDHPSMCPFIDCNDQDFKELVSNCPKKCGKC